LASLESQGIIAPQQPADAADGELAVYAITPEGRKFIAGLLAETESCIDQYDHFQDALIDLDQDTVEFGSGRGIDLRAQAFLSDGLDPIRAVFLLRLYDGTLDSRRRDGREALESDAFFEAVLEPAYMCQQQFIETGGRT